MFELNLEDSLFKINQILYLKFSLFNISVQSNKTSFTIKPLLQKITGSHFHL